MANRVPVLYERHRICIICEGNEEYEYLNRLNSLGVWNEQYDISCYSADGNGNIPARYQDKYQNGSFELVLIFCDTEKKPYEQYEDIKRKINEFHGKDDAADHIIIFGNPCTMQIIIKHWCDEVIKKPLKSANAPLIEKYTGLNNYKGRTDQLNVLMNCITKENYYDMCARVKTLSQDDSLTGSSNFIRLISWLESSEIYWINDINDMLDE